MSNQIIAPESFSCTTLAVLRGKGATAALKVRQALQNEAYLGVMLSEGVARKAIIEKLTEADVAAMYRDVANAAYTRPMATLVAISERPFTYSRVDGIVPRSDWMRLGEELKVATSKRAAKARELWVSVQAEADRIFAERKANQKAIA